MGRAGLANVAYIRIREGRARAHGLIDYVSREGEAARARGGELLVWGPDGPMTRREAHAWLDREAEGAVYAYTIVLSPAPGVADHWGIEDWRRYTDNVLREMEGHHRGRWIAVVHDDERHPHVHVMALTDRTLTRADLREINSVADREAAAIALEVDREAGLDVDRGLDRGLDWEVDRDR